ncbi:MAG: serine hydroxymethyltransferase [Candidatus Hadarchaeum yellowstonense]|jgi:glycine hydroxymethyltransferase|uniref:Serine hydroxymethyltransferase n=1 Tax=Hadarchaeum yellowstonense TaxID=1776334 RepID=A0A147JZ31_HADYE|nr:MAG: serine hydroxymethyltransferase [Candidatus Hadarchaeum yellowstonense]
MMRPREAYDKTLELLQKHHEWFKSVIPLIASENVTSPAVREAMICDFQHRYAEGWPGERVYAGCIYIDQVEIIAMELARELFKAEHANVQPVSGLTANLAAFTALTDPGDTMMCLSVASGGHISMAKKKFGGSAGAVHGLEIEYLPLDEKRMNIDVEAAAKKIAEVKPKLVTFGGSLFLFPHPVKELSEVAKENGAHVMYDAAHVAGLIAGGQFQDPLREGAEVMTCSTHKTLPGPQHGMILCTKELADAINRAVFPGIVSNHHLHSVAALAIALAEMLEFGKEYTAQIVKNAKALGKALYDQGLAVLCPDLGFTESHIVVVDVSKYGDGGTLEKKLEEANIILNRNLLPWDPRQGRHYKNPSGIRLGTSEVTRLGMKEGEMKQIAEFIRRIIIDNEDPKKVAGEVAEFRKDYQKVHYCFESATEAYEYIKIR